MKRSKTVPFNQVGSIYVAIVLAVLLIGIAAGGYIVLHQTNFKPQAAQPKKIIMQNVYLLESSKSAYKVGELIQVKLIVKSESNQSNLFASKLDFPIGILEVVSIAKDRTTIKNWVEDFYDNQSGEISLVGGVPNPGYKTAAGMAGLTLANINFRIKAPGTANISISPDSAIYRNSDNMNILKNPRGLQIKIK